MKLEKINTFLLALFISWGPIFWFPYIGKILVIKLALMALIIGLNIKAFFKVKVSTLLIFFTALLLFIYVLNDYTDGFSNRFINVYNNLICALAFFVIGEKDSIRIKPLFRISCDLVCIYCIVLLFFLVFHIIEYFPVEYSRELTNGTTSMIPLYDSGWGFGRTQWSTTLSVFVPAHYIAFDQKEDRLRLYLGILLILTIQFISGGRGGLVASSMTILLLLFFRLKNKMQYIVFLVAFVGVTIYFSSKYSEHLRLNYEHLSIQRKDQWLNFSIILSNLPFKGYGYYGGTESMLQFGVTNAFHDSFFRCLFGFGIAGAFTDCIILFIFFKGFFLIKKSRDDFFKLSCIGLLFCAFICTFTEPHPIVVSFYWPSWWLLAGFLIQDSDTIKSQKAALNPINYNTALLTQNATQPQTGISNSENNVYSKG